MSIKGKIKDTVMTSFRELKEMKNVFLAKKQGEALERASRPIDLDEALSLGNMNQQGVYAANVILAHQKFIEELTTSTRIEETVDKSGKKTKKEIIVPGHKGTILEDFVKGIFQGSGSIGAKRLDKTFETVGSLGQYRPGPPTYQPWNEEDKPPEAD